MPVSAHFKPVDAQNGVGWAIMPPRALALLKRPKWANKGILGFDYIMPGIIRHANICMCETVHKKIAHSS